MPFDLARLARPAPQLQLRDAKVRASGRSASNRYRHDLLAYLDAMVQTSTANPTRGTLVGHRTASNRYHNDLLVRPDATVLTSCADPARGTPHPCAGAIVGRRTCNLY